MNDEPDWVGRVLVRWTRMLVRHRVWMGVVLVGLTVLFSGLSSRIRWQPDVLEFFSAESADLKNMRAAARETGIFNHVRMDVHFIENVKRETRNAKQEELREVTRELVSVLEKTRKFKEVWTGVEESKLAGAYGRLMQQGAGLLTDEERAEVEGRATREYLEKRFTEVRGRLVDPDGEIAAKQLQSDPLDVASVVQGRLRNLGPAGDGNGPTMVDGMLMAQDPEGGWHAMIVAQPLALASNQRDAEAMLAATYNAIDAVRSKHPGMEVWLIGAHRGYIENAHRIMADVTVVSIVGTLLVGAAIAIWFRRVSTALLCIIPPSVGVGLAMGLAGAMGVTLPLLLLGFTGLLCGSTTDYGIQIISECRRLFARAGGVWDADIPAVAARRMMGPISMSVATSVTGFAALGLSDAPGLRVLGLFVAAATVCIWGITFLILPACLGTWVLAKESKRRNGETATGRMGVIARWAGLATFVVMTIWLATVAWRVRFNMDSRALDGSTAALHADEEKFFYVWGDLRNRAMVLVSGAQAEEAFERMERVADFLRDQERDGVIASVQTTAGLLPSQRTLEERAVAWKAYWTAERRGQLRGMLAAAAGKNGFRGESFASYADRVGEVEFAPAEQRLRDSPAVLFPGFAEIGEHRVRLATMVKMRGGWDHPSWLATGWGAELRSRFPEVTIISGNLLLFDATQRSRAEGERLGPWCLVAILVPLWVYFRRLRTAWLAMVCLMVGFVWVLGSAEMFGSGLNLLSLVPVLFTLGVAVDYGIYAASDPAWRGGSKRRNGETANRRGDDSRLPATFLCALTTILGSGALILAGHPAMRWLGITLVAGISGGYLTSLFVVAPAMRWWHRREHRGIWAGAGRWGLRLGLAVVTLLLLVPPVVEVILKNEQPAGVEGVARARPEVVQTGRRVFQAGQSWMRWRETSAESGLWEMMLVGSPEERGMAANVLAGPIDVRIENEMLDQLDYFLPQMPTRWLVLRGMAANLVTLPQYVPAEYQREIYWNSESGDDPHRYLAPSYPRILSYHALHDVSQMLIDNPLIVPNSFACTGVISLPEYSAISGGHLMLARNFDFEGGESFGRQKSITYVIPPKGEGIPFAHVAWPGLAGAVTGMNREKLAVFINAAATKDFRRIGTPTILMVREVLQHARTIEEAEKIIRAAEVFVSDIIVVADGKTGQVRIFEKSPREMASYDVERSAMVANHLSTSTFAQDSVNVSRKNEGTTMQRYSRARELLDRMEHHVTVETLAGLLRDKRGVGDKDLGFGNRNAIDGLIACHAVVIDVTAGEMWVASWPNAEGAFVGVDVMKMLEEGGGNPLIAAAASQSGVPIDTMMTDGSWQRVIEGRRAASDAEDSIRKHDAAKALSTARQVIQDNPSFYLGHVLLGRALLLQNDFAGAKTELNRAMLLDPPYAATRNAIKELLQRCDTY